MEQWAKLEKVNDALTQEYTVRRRMLLKRADVTVRSFTWSGKMKVSTLLPRGWHVWVWTVTHAPSQQQSLLTGQGEAVIVCGWQWPARLLHPLLCMPYQYPRSLASNAWCRTRKMRFRVSLKPRGRPCRKRHPSVLPGCWQPDKVGQHCSVSNVIVTWQSCDQHVPSFLL